MTAEPHDASQQNLHANLAGSGGDCKPSAHSSLSWRCWGQFFAVTMLASFVLNEIWEMTQMPAYVETAGHSWMSTLSLCSRAAVGDVGIVLGIYAAGALAAGRWSYTERMPVVSVLGAGLWQLLQMTLLPPLTFFFARWWAGRSATKGTL